jgi:5-(carboxyamino)imidazole ribonucleotide synthase
MLFESSLDLDLELHFMDPDPQAPCKDLGASFTVGDINDSTAVRDFASNLDLISIEIERVSVEGLRELEEMGKEVYPSSELIGMVQNKARQKNFFKEHGIPTAPFVTVSGREEMRNSSMKAPFVNKIAVGGYDGRGVFIVKSDAEIEKCFDEPGILEELADIEKEISVVVVRSKSGEISCFPTVEMVFDPVANLVDHLISPAEISREKSEEAEGLSKKLAGQMSLVGVMAVEMFLLKDGKIWVNEVAPRPHNSGHQSIEGNFCSQYDQHLRAILDLPLGSTETILPSAMINILGSQGYEGPPIYSGLEKILDLKGAYVHLYAKKITKPFRKMGHVTVLAKNIEELEKRILFVKEHLKIIA